MRWIDLKPGDIVEINPDFLEAFVDKFGRKPRFSRNSGGYMDFDTQFFVVREVHVQDKNIKVTVDGHHPISILPDTGALHKLNTGPSIFNIVSLSED